jgi:hypothetical protein
LPTKGEAVGECEGEGGTEDEVGLKEETEIDLEKEESGSILSKDTMMDGLGVST